jgi:hypothetical protein
MKRLVLVALAVLSGVGSLALAQQPQKVIVVRDDDGTPDEGRGHVSGPPHVARKTLHLDRDPAGITQAWVMYYMKHNPYDVATKTLYGAPAAGVKWSDFVVAVNGHEVLRDSLIKHATQGWHEIPVDPALLVRGENTVTMTLADWGSYFYLGLDRSAPRGRSASSQDQGRTFRPNWLSFGTKEADPGEYMIRLKLLAPPPPEVGFVARDGHHYGWLEPEDLFSTTRPHVSGFRALPWERGVNQPSGDLVAYAMVGSFETPLDFPADGQWRLWLRGWMDGFRGGAFTLTWDGKPFYSSAGKHEFTSDAQLRFDWLDLGSLKLTKGRHVLGIATTGDCGHMFDVLVLTTDPAYRPDESKPLPRMTRIEKLTRPEGLADVQPGQYMTANPIPWARPLAGGPLRTLWVCGGINEREIVELQQRMDLAADVISSNMDYYGKSVFGSDLNMDQGDLLYDLLVSDKPYEVLVLVRTKLDQIPEHAMEELLRRVREGMGLIVVRSLREGEAETKLSALLKDAKPAAVTAFKAPFDLNRQASVAWGEYGQGRVVVCSYANWGMLDQLRQPATELRFPFWEYQLGHWVKLLQKAGRRDMARLLGVSVPETVAPGQTVELAVTAEGNAGTQLAGVIWAPNQPGWTKWGPMPCAGAATVKLALGVEDGLYHIETNLLNAQGEVLDSAITFTRVSRAVRLAEIKAEYSVDGGGQCVLTLQTANGGAATRLPARLEVWGARERLLGTRAVTLDVAAGEAETKLSVPVLPSWERLLELRVTLGPADGPPLQRAFVQFTRPQPVVLDDYLTFTGTHENREAPTYCWPAYSRLYDDMGIRTDYPGQMFGASLHRGAATAVIFRLTSVGSSSTGPGGERIPCLHDPEMWAKEEPQIRSLARHFGRYSPLTLGLGDEMGISHGDEVCFSKHTLAAFREQLRKDYGTLEQLNATWETQFADWEAVLPWKVEQARQRPANIAPWLDFRVFMTRTFVDSLVKMQTWVKAEAPGAYTGGANPLDESYKSCSIFSQLYPALEYAQVYPRFHDRARSWFRDPRLVGLWSGYGYDRATLELHAWLLPAYSGTVMCWYGSGREWDYRTLTNTLNMGEPGRAIQGANRELQAGIGKLLIGADVEPEPVAILSAWRSKYAYTALKASKTPTISPTGWDQEFDEFLQGYSALLRKLRVPYRYIDEDQVERGELARYQLLIAPQAAVLSDVAVAKLRAFATQHPVIADRALGTYDEHGRERTAPWDMAAPGDLKLSDFGDRPLRVTDENLTRLRQVVEAAGVVATQEVAGDSLDFIVRKRLGGLRMLVVFGRGEMRVTPPGGMVAYDARAHKLLGAGPMTHQQERSPAVIVFAPQKLSGIRLTAPATVARGQAVSFALQAQPGLQTVVRLAVTGPDGQPRPWYDANVTIRDGGGSASFRPALNDAVGKWTFTATEVISGARAAATLTVK